jgi:uroporphyrinogen decarboxylase
MKIETPFKEGYDFEHLRKVLMRETTEGPVPIFELAVDPEIMSEATGIDFPVKRFDELINISPDSPPETLQLGVQLMDLIIDFYQAMGYDYVVMTPLLFIPRTRMQLKENPQQDGKMRGWQNEHRGLIMTREDLEEFPWPSPESINILPVEYAADKIPEGMKVVVFIFGIFEDLKLLMSFENMAIKSIDEPELLGDILEKLTVLQEVAIDMAAAHPATGAILYAEDMGFNTATMLSPAWMQEWVIPRHKRLADACHRHDKPFILHSCGQIDALMQDEIETVGIDARHSFQDNIEPVEEVYEKYGDRISILGGIDVDLLARGTQEEVARRTRQALEACAPGGGFCMGSGNSVANFCRIENYYAMLDETRRWNQEHGWI